jgi:lipopolysaccharide export system permease protein
VGICSVLIMIFAGYSAVKFLNDAVNGLLSGGTVVKLVALKVIIAFEVLLPVTLYLAVVLALGRLYADSEITAMEACGFSHKRIILSILLLALPLSLGVTGLSLYARPWAYQKFYALESGARDAFDFAKVEAGRFYEMDEHLVFFAETFDPAAGQAHDVWIWELRSGRRKVTCARNAYQINGPGEGQRSIVMQNGHHYILNLKTDADSVVRFQENVLHLEPSRTPPPQYRRKAAPTAELARSSSPEDSAEFQWRLSTGLTTVLMCLLAVPLGRAAPRGSKYGKVTAAIILFFVFYHLSLIAKTWVEKQMVGTPPGIWWVTLLLGVLVLALLPDPSPLRRIILRRFRPQSGTEA